MYTRDALEKREFEVQNKSALIAILALGYSATKLKENDKKSHADTLCSNHRVAMQSTTAAAKGKVGCVQPPSPLSESNPSRSLTPVSPLICPCTARFSVRVNVVDDLAQLDSALLLNLLPVSADVHALILVQRVLEVVHQFRMSLRDCDPADPERWRGRPVECPGPFGPLGLAWERFHPCLGP